MLKKSIFSIVSCIVSMNCFGGSALESMSSGQSNPYFDLRYTFLDSRTLYNPVEGHILSDEEALAFLGGQRRRGSLVKIGADFVELLLFSSIVAGVSSVLPAQNLALAHTSSFLFAQSAWVIGLPEKIAQDARIIFSELGALGCTAGLKEILPQIVCMPFLMKDIITNYEVKLIQKWSFLPHSFRESLADALFLIRRSKAPLGENIQDRFMIFDIPDSEKVLTYNPEVLQEGLTGLSLELVEQLKSIAFQHVMQSQTRQSAVARKISLYFLGPPGVGKTKAARALAQGMGAPACSIMLSDKKAQDVARALIRCLVESKCTNPVVILDDADRALNNEDDPHFLNLALTLNDPETLYIQDFFSDILVPVGQMTFIYTGNHAVMRRGVPIEAFEQRVVTLQFDGFSVQYQKQHVVDKVLPALVAQYSSDGVVTVETMMPLVEDYFAKRENQSEPGQSMRVSVEAVKRIYFEALRKGHEGALLTLQESGSFSEQGTLLLGDASAEETL